MHKIKRMLRAILSHAKKQRLIVDNYATVDYIDFPKRPSIERSVTTVKGVGLVEKDPKTESSKRVISISDKLVAVLMEYKEWYDQYKYDVGDRWHETNRLFISEDRKVMYPGTIS